jgi:hypothetical protein
MLLLEVGKCRCRSGCREGDSIDQNLEGDRKEKREKRREKREEVPGDQHSPSRSDIYFFILLSYLEKRDIFKISVLIDRTLNHLL